MTQTGHNEGDQAPDFALADQSGNLWQLSDHLGKVIVLLFYPGDNTPVCTKQLCSVRNRWEDYTATGAEVIGISTDSPESHEKFAGKHDLPLKLLSDTKEEATKLYKVSSWLPGRAARAVVVIDPKGYIRYRKVQPLSLFRPNDSAILDAITYVQQNFSGA